MPSFDVVSEVDLHEARNAVDQAIREIDSRFDFKKVNASFELLDTEIIMKANQEFHLNQMMDILRQKMVKRKVDVNCLDAKEPEVNLSMARQQVVLKQGIDSDIAKKMVKEIKASKIKVQSQIQGDQLRVSGKKRDDLQQVMTLLKGGDFGQPLQFTNFRD